MKKKKDQKAFSLTKNEMLVMEMFWESTEPLSVMELADILEQREQGKIAVQNILGFLLRKGAIETVGVTQNFKRIARLFSPTVTPDQYAAMQLVNDPSYKRGSVAGIITALVKDQGVSKEELSSALEQLVRD